MYILIYAVYIVYINEAKEVLTMADKNNGVLTIRADEEIKAKFKALAENLGNQGTALESLLNAYEMQNEKDVLTERRTDKDFAINERKILREICEQHGLEIEKEEKSRGYIRVVL